MPSITHHRWKDTSAEQITDSISRRYITGDALTVARFELTKGGVVPMHSHHNEQISCVQSGKLEFRFGDRVVIVGPNEVMQIPSNLPHEVHVLEDTVVIDVFSPVRQDWIDKTDAYFKRT